MIDRNNDNDFAFDWRMRGGNDAAYSSFPPLPATQGRRGIDVAVEGVKNTGKGLYKLSSDLAQAVLGVAASAYNIAYKFALVLQTMYFVLGNVIPLAVGGVIVASVGAKDLAKSIFNKASHIANNNIRIASVVSVFQDVLLTLPNKTPAAAFGSILMSVPALGAVVLATAATVWHDRVTKAAYKVGKLIGFIKPDAGLESDLNQSINRGSAVERAAEFGGALTAVAAARAIAPTVARAMAPITTCLGPTGMVTAPLVAAAGAELGRWAFDKYRSSSSSTSSLVHPSPSSTSALRGQGAAPQGSSVSGSNASEGLTSRDTGNTRDIGNTRDTGNTVDTQEGIGQSDTSALDNQQVISSPESTGNAPTGSSISDSTTPAQPQEVLRETITVTMTPRM